MSHKRSFKQSLNMKNVVRGGLDQQKFQAQKKIIDGHHLLRDPKWPVDMHVGRYISSTHPITQTQLGLVGIVIVTAVASGGIGGEFLSETANDHAAGSHVVKDRIDRDCDADPHMAVVTPPNGEPDASANSVLVAMADSISQRTEQWIRNGAKNVVCQQMPRSMRELSLGWR